MHNFIDNYMESIKEEVNERYLELKGDNYEGYSPLNHSIALTARVDVYEKHLLHLLREVECFRYES